MIRKILKFLFPKQEDYLCDKCVNRKSVSNHSICYQCKGYTYFEEDNRYEKE